MVFTIEKKNRIIALFLICGAIIAGLIFGTFFEIVKEIQSSFEIPQEDYNVSRIELYNNIKLGTINFELLPENSINVIEAYWKIRYMAPLFDSNSISINIIDQTVGDILKIYLDIESLEYALTRDYSLWNITVGINPNFELYNFTSNSEAGNVNFDAYGIDFGKFEVKTTTGSVDIDFNRTSIFNDLKIETTIGEHFLTLDFVSIHGDVICRSISGYIYLDFWNIQFLSDANLKVSTTTGKINARWATHFKKTHKVNVALKTNFDTEFRYWYPQGNTRFDVCLSETTGSSHCGVTAVLFDKSDPYHIQSTNIGDESIDYLKINVSTNEGDIFIKLVNCFKPHRFCGRYKNMPHEEDEIGSYAIPKTNYNVSTLKIYNRAKNVVINFGSLSINSSNIIEANWLLTFWHGANFGYGPLEVKFTTKIEDNTLILYIDLVYELDRLRPVFTECDFTIQVNPSYTFYYY